jgi:hypothetical protein
MSSEVVLACAICFGGADGPLLDAARLGVLVMVGVTVVVLVLFARFFLRISKNGDSPRFKNPHKPWVENRDSPGFQRT